MKQSKWGDVANLEELAQLNLKIAADALNDAVEHLVECRKELEKCLKITEEYQDGQSNS